MRHYIIIALITSFINLTCSYSMQELRNGNGWVDADTFQVSSTGTPAGNAADISKRKEASREDAISNAQSMIIRAFKRYSVKSQTGLDRFDTTGKDIPRELEDIVKNGNIQEETWDENQKCEIVYIVHAKNLANLVKIAEWK